MVVHFNEVTETLHGKHGKALTKLGFSMEGHAVLQLTEALCYKPERHSFDSQ
jgi:hypothetical protein